MAALGEIPHICDNIRKATTKSIRNLYKFITERNGDRDSRKYLRVFRGFNFDADSVEYRKKATWAAETFTLGDLVGICNVLNLDYSGQVGELVTRISEHLADTNLLWAASETNISETEEESENEIRNDTIRPFQIHSGSLQAPSRTMSPTNRAVTQNPPGAQEFPKFVLNFRDIEEAIRPFNGTDGYPIENWLQDFEENATLLGWSDLQKLLFAKKCLTGLARLFMQGERGITTWGKLKSLLLDEFSSRTNSAQLHQMLRDRQMQRNESVHEYFLVMREMAARGGIEAEALIQYIVDGIPDDPCRKSQLYEARNLNELKDKLRIYERVRNLGRPVVKKPLPMQMQRKEEKQPLGRSSLLVGDSKQTIRCFNCNETGHLYSACPKPRRERGTCYICGASDHKKQSCPRYPTSTKERTPKPSTSATTTHLVQFTESVIPCYTINASLEVGKVTAVLDTGSPVSFLSETLIPSHIIINPNNNSVQFEGVNRSRIKILGRLRQTLIVADCEAEIDFYVIPRDTMSCTCLLGRDFITNDNLEIILGKTVQIRRKSLKTDEEYSIPEILKIDIVDEYVDCTTLPNIKVNENIDWESRNKVESILLKHYTQPKRPESAITKLELELVLKPNHQPFYYNPRRLSFSEKNAVEIIIKELLDRKIIRSSTSQYCSPIVLIKKKSGQYRMAVDYRNLNKLTLKDHFPIPRIDDQIDELRDKVYFTQLDLRDAFHHISLHENSRKYTSFITFMGQFEYMRMPFGLSNGPSFFMRFINTAFRKLLDERKILIYLDDILIVTKTIDENLKILKETLDILVENRLELKFEKCAFLLEEIIYLGYCINSTGIRPNKDNIQAVAEYPIPRNYRELQSFLGLVSYFRKFIKNFALLAKPLYDLLKAKTAYRWDDEMLKCFEKLKEILMTKPVLAIYSPLVETELHCDASSHGFGSVLLQKQADGKFHPICYFSKRTSKTESKYHSFELEALAIVYSLERFRIYLQGIQFKIVTDCQSLKLTLERKEINPRILRWSLVLRNYDYVLEHRPGDKLVHADALSREFSVLIITENSFERNLAILQNQDSQIKKLHDTLLHGENKFFELNNGLVYRKINNKLLFYVPASMEENIIRTNHEEIGHQGINKTVEYISRVYWFPDKKQKVQKFIMNCLKCITYSSNANRVEGILQCPDKGSVPFYCIHIDFYGPLERTRHRQKYIFEIIDAFTKFVKFYPAVTTNADEAIRHLQTYFSNYSRPKKIVSDRGSAFTSNKFKEFLSEYVIQHVLIATATPHANGQIERINRSLTPMLSKLSFTTGSWNEALSKVEYAINNTFNRSIGNTPCKLLFGVNQTGQVNDDLRVILEENDIRDLNAIRENAVAKIQTSNEYNKQYYNKRHKYPTRYSIGDYVVIKNVDVTPGINKKLLPKFRGPYQISKVLDKNRYVIRDLEGQQLTQLPFEGIYSPENMRLWINPNVENG
ncbi:Transposon Ty3-I Gag-Pol polyprotein [Anthophora plagiata]